MEKIVAVVGTNASGKSGLAVYLAHRFDGEIISADSRQVYRGLDIGAGKLTHPEMEGVAHHLIDVAEPSQVFSVADFQRLAYTAIEDILRRGKLPLIVGGTGLYVRAVIEGFQLTSTPPDPELRTRLEELDTDALAQLLTTLSPDRGRSVDIRNRRRLVRAIEVAVSGEETALRDSSPRYLALQLGVTWPREILYQRIDRRLAHRLEHGMIEEVAGLLEHGVSALDLERFGLEYRYILRYLKGEYGSVAALYDALRHAIHAFARRQLTWFRRDRAIRWLDTEHDYRQEAEAAVKSFLGPTA